MSDNTNVKVEVSKECKALLATIIAAQFSERTNWDNVVILGGIGVIINDKKCENATAKTAVALEFKTVYAEKHAAGKSKESAEYKDAFKNGGAHFAKCCNDALVRMGYKPPKPERAKPVTTTATTASAPATPNPSDAALAKRLEFSADVQGLIHEAQRLATAAVEAVKLFGSASKLTKAQQVSYALVLQHVELVPEAVAKVEAAILAGPQETDPVPVITNALNAATKANGATVQ